MGFLDMRSVVSHITLGKKERIDGKTIRVKKGTYALEYFVNSPTSSLFCLEVVASYFPYRHILSVLYRDTGFTAHNCNAEKLC